MSQPDPHNLYATRPDLYDVMHREHVDDMRFIQEFVQLLGAAPQVLELGSGTGRLLTAMLDAGASVTGLDQEPAMVAVARERLRPFGDRARVITGDMRRFALQQRFDLVVLGLNTFMHMLTTADQLDCLQAIHAHVRPAGMLLIDLANPHSVLRDMPINVLQHRFTRPAGGDQPATVTLWSSAAIAVADQLVQSMLFFDEVDSASQTVRRTIAEITLRLLYRYELELLLTRTGFALRGLYGDYQSSPYDDESERLICVAAALA
ncbi:MAG TPA: class I SAM-dependent methyltransferase [Chloroflexota bacterium]|jgi:SAM-dependent methyltransferase|nr:class I SAM-dependent methyltransferase [Chloroflexota bacterium]